MSGPDEPGLAEARCASHPDIQATAVCGRCGLFLCGDCIGMFGTELRCDRCAKLAQAEHSRQVGSSGLSRTAAAVCFTSFIFWPLAVVGVPLALTELWRIRTGRSPRGGRRITLFGLLAGLVGLGLLAMVAATRFF